MSKKSTRNCGETEQHALVVNARHVVNSAEAILSLDFSSIVPNRASQVTIGWLRAAFAQSRAIANLYIDDLASHAAPNRRQFWELALRLMWLHDIKSSNRTDVLNTMLDNDRKHESQTHKHFQSLDLDSDIDIEAMEEFHLEIIHDKEMERQARLLAEAAKSLKHRGATIYRLWRNDSAWTHASGFLAGQYAPVENRLLAQGQPKVVDPVLTVHRHVGIVIAFVASQILREEGVETEVAKSPFMTLMQV